MNDEMVFHPVARKINPPKTNYKMLDRKDCDIFVIARMSPTRNARTRRLIRALARNFKVRVVSENTSGAPQKTQYLDGARLDEIMLPYPKLRLWYFTGLLRVIYFNVSSILMALKSQASAVVCSDSIYSPAGFVFKLMLKRKFVYNSHEIMWALGNPSYLSSLLGWFEKSAIRICDFWLVPSEERAAIILNKHRLAKPYVVYENYPIRDGYPSDRSALLRRATIASLPRNKPVVMFQGSVARGRGLEELIQVAQTSFFHLIIQGQGPLLDELRSKGSKHVTFLEACPNKDAIDWLSIADLSFVYYENNCLNSAYACSSKFYASVFANVPIICNPLPAFRTFAAKYGGAAFFDSLDPKSVEACIQKALHPSCYPKLKKEIQNANKSLAATRLEQKINRAFYRMLVVDQS